MLRAALFVIALSLSAQLPAQEEEAEADTVPSKDTAHSPSTATLRSALLPGLGQAYNEKYWKIPIIYGGLGASTYFIVRNTRQFQNFRQAYIARVDPDRTDDYQNIYNQQQLNTLKSTYRRWRDLSYIAFIGVYVLQVVDANVDAHLYDFDVGEDLSLHMRPWSSGGRTSLGLPPSGGVSVALRF